MANSSVLKILYVLDMLKRTDCIENAEVHQILKGIYEINDTQ